MKRSKEKPANRAGFDRNRAKITQPSPIHGIDCLFVMECEIALSYYHGGQVRAGWSLLCKGIRSAVHGFYLNCVFRFCDKIGWTRLQPIPDSDAFERHSAKCDKMNCADMDCVQSGIPMWYKKLTGINRE